MSEPLSMAEFQAITAVSRETGARLMAYLELLRKWQPALNLVGPATLKDPWRRHFLDSAQLAPLLPPMARRLVDFGSGAGFPGLVLAILSGLETDLIESDSRKAVFLREAARLTAAPVTVHAVRIEDMQGLRADVVSARAVASLDQLCAYAAPVVGENGVCLFPKGRTGAEELTGAQKKWTMDTEIFPSQSDPSGRIFRLTGLKLIPQQPATGRERQGGLADDGKRKS